MESDGRCSLELSYTKDPDLCSHKRLVENVSSSEPGGTKRVRCLECGTILAHGNPPPDRLSLTRQSDLVHRDLASS
jgi:hypothetical protein